MKLAGSALTDILKGYINRCSMGERSVFRKDHKTEDDMKSINRNSQIGLLGGDKTKRADHMLQRNSLTKKKKNRHSQLW